MIAERTAPLQATTRRTRKNRPAPFGIFTSVEGILLDSSGSVPPGLSGFVQQLKIARVPIVPISSMTLDQLTLVAPLLSFRHVALVENGGAIARWDGGRWIAEGCGPTTDVLLDAVREIEDRTGASLLVYSALTDEEAGRLSGLSGEMLRASKLRRYSEPFLVESGEESKLRDAASQIGYRLRRGRDFMHLCTGEGEGEVFARVRREVPCDITIAVGSTIADAEFLRRADFAVIVPRIEGFPDPGLLAAVPRARVAPVAGWKGWIAAISELSREVGGESSVAKPA